MSKKEAHDWAHFIVDKLGLPYVKSEIADCVENEGTSEVWNKYIASNKEYLDAAKANRIEGPADVERFFRDASYAGMRATFPSKSHGRTVIGPRIVSLQKLREQKRAKEKKNEQYKVSFLELNELKSSVGRRVVHSANNGVKYGKGLIVGINAENGTILVEFENGMRRSFNYKFCIDKGFVRFE